LYLLQASSIFFLTIALVLINGIKHNTASTYNEKEYSFIWLNLFLKECSRIVDEKANWIYVNTLDKNLGFLLISATIDNPNINAQGFLPEGEELKAS